MNGQQDNPNDLLSHALRYLNEFGWAVIPVGKANRKQSLVSWKECQTKRPDEAALRKWFSGSNATGLAVVLGKVSGSLYVRDFDEEKVYQEWAGQFPKAAKSLPTAQTGRGYHVYFRADLSFRVTKVEAGELRGGGGYVVLPPSLHQSEIRYQWLVSPTKDNLVPIDPYSEGLVLKEEPATEGKHTERSERTDENRRGSKRDEKCIKEIEGRIKIIVKDFIPTAPHQNHEKLFNLARAWRAIELEFQSEFTPETLKLVFDNWHALVPREFLRLELDQDDYYFEFLDSYNRVICPLGENAITAAWGRARHSPLPTAALLFHKPKLQLLVALCRELQRVSRDNPFFLSCRTVQLLLDYKTADSAAKLLRGLVQSNIIKVVNKGGPLTNRATRFKYLPRLDDDSDKMPSTDCLTVATPTAPSETKATAEPPRPVLQNNHDAEVCEMAYCDEPNIPF